MPRFRKTQSPERQVDSVMAELLRLGVLRRNPNRPPSLRTVDSHSCNLLQIARHFADHGRELRDLDPESSTAYLEGRVDDLGQKMLDSYRRTLQVLQVHINDRLAPRERLPRVRSSKPPRRGGRAYTPVQARRVAAAQNAHNGLATLIAYAAGLRAHELLTLARPGDRPPDRRPALDSKFRGRPGRDYTVVGKGGLVRLVRLPVDLAERLEALRRDAPARITDRGIHYASHYDLPGGVNWSASFSGASKRALGWTRGGHGLRHSYAQERMRELQRTLLRPVALETVSQELGHFRPEITETYLR